MGVAVRFYVPEAWWPTALPSSPDEYWEWVVSQSTVNSPINRWIGARYGATIRTWLHLRDAGVRCDLTNEPPNDGIVITHTDFLPRGGTEADLPWKRPGRFERWMASAFVVCFQADRLRHPYSHMHVVQNGTDAARHGAGTIGHRAGLRVHYVPLWTQPGLRPRADDGGERFTNIAYFGIPDELDPSLRDEAWHERLRDQGFDFMIAAPESWSDYSEVDAIVAARSFTYPGEWLLKPPSKLFNAWLAGVPAILGAESAYRAERHSDLDYLEVTSRDHVEAALVMLRDDPSLRKAMVENGRSRALEVSDEAITERWRHFLDMEAIPAYEQWQASSSMSRLGSLATRSAYVKLDAVIGPLATTHRATREVWRHRGDWR